MSFAKLRRCIFIIAALALFLVTVLPNNVVSAAMLDSTPAAVAMAAKMPCPNCNTNAMKASAPMCAQITCIGFAVITESDLLAGTKQRVFFQSVVLQPNEISLALSTPPI